MNKLHIIVAALAGMIAVTSCEVDTSEWNSTPWSLESYSIGLRCLSAEFPAVKMSEMLDFGTESMFGPGEHKTKMVLEQYGGNTEAELVTKYVADTTWAFTVTSGADGIFENMNAKGTISFHTLRKGVRDWQVEVHHINLLFRWYTESTITITSENTKWIRVANLRLFFIVTGHAFLSRV